MKGETISMDHSSIPKNHEQIPSVGLTSSCNEASLLKEELRRERLRSDTLEGDLAKLRKEHDYQRREFDSLSLLLEYTDLSREELEKKLSQVVKALTGSG